MKLSQNTSVPNGRSDVAGRVSPSKRRTQQNTIPQDHPEPSDWKHIQESYEEKIQSYEERIQNYEERIRKLSEENNNLRSETAVQRNQLQEKEKRIEELTTR